MGENANVAGGRVGGADAIRDWIRGRDVGPVTRAGQCAASCYRRVALRRSTWILRVSKITRI